MTDIEVSVPQSLRLEICGIQRETNYIVSHESPNPPLLPSTL